MYLHKYHLAFNMEDLNSYILDHLDADEKKALSVYSRSLGYSSFLDTLLQTFKNLEIKDDLKMTVQNWNQMLFPKKSHLF